MIRICQHYKAQNLSYGDKTITLLWVFFYLANDVCGVLYQTLGVALINFIRQPDYLGKRNLLNRIDIEIRHGPRQG